MDKEIEERFLLMEEKLDSIMEYKTRWEEYQKRLKEGYPLIVSGEKSVMANKDSSTELFHKQYKGESPELVATNTDSKAKDFEDWVDFTKIKYEELKKYKKECEREDCLKIEEMLCHILYFNKSSKPKDDSNIIHTLDSEEMQILLTACENATKKKLIAEFLKELKYIQKEELTPTEIGFIIKKWEEKPK